MLVQAEEYRKRWLMEMQLLGLEREKALETQAGLLDVSAGQLRACVALGRAAVAGGDDDRVREAAQTAKAMEGLLVVPTPLCTNTRLDVLCDQSAALGCLENRTRLQHFEVDAGRSSVTGNGLTAYANDGVARNVIRVTCMDSDGGLADWATLADADVGLTVNGVTWQAVSADLIEPGVVEVTYVVEEGGAEEIEVGLALRGVAVPGGPWRPHAGFMAKGVHIATLLLGEGAKHEGLAVSSDGSLIVLSNARTDTLDVYRTEDGSHVRTLGGRDTGPGEFMYPWNLCMTGRGTVLVAELRNRRIQEVTLEGVHVKSIPVGGVPYGVTVHEDLVAVAVSVAGDLTTVTGDLVAVRQRVFCIQVLNYTTGALVRRIRTAANGWSICFAPDGKHLAVSDRESIKLMSMDGQSVRRIGPKVLWRRVAFTCTGDVIGVGRSSVSVISATDGKVLRLLTAENDGKAACGVAVSGNRLYLLKSGRVQVFE